MLRLAGLETYPEGFAREPTAALANWYEGEASPEKYSWFLVFDLGGGTLDISIVYQQGKYNLTVAGKKGDMFLGGEDFDDAMRKLVLDSFKRDHPSALEPSAAKAAELQRACKVAKETFQEDPDLQVQTITVASFCRSPTGEDVTLDVNVSREAYDEALSGLLEACMRTVDEAIKITGEATMAGSDVRSECPPFDRSKLDKGRQFGRKYKCKQVMCSSNVLQVLMVGGSSKMLLVQSSLRKVFGEKVEVLDRPEEAVARGAALMASISEARQSGQNEHGVYAMSIAESLPIGIGFRVHDVTTERYRMEIVLPAGTPFGRTKSKDNCYVMGTSFVLTVLQGNRDDYDGLAECIVVQQFRIERPKWKSGGKKIFLHIEFHVMVDGSLRVRIEPPNKEDA
ncbi:HSPA1_8 [Klebsormidium nitens]|uniref:HSPA1_8 n=1 Tax=Klebsormidium nitens TaxID=105231 RepID=A0A1Y1IIQ4_KLENI|nr:HSPA1_8 [Klebsormidium nitens]|eukprot:GAQ90583.1 HSPA1_8 [Klebsormidium nitens]